MSRGKNKRIPVLPVVLLVSIILLISVTIIAENNSLTGFLSYGIPEDSFEEEVIESPIIEEIIEQPIEETIYF